MTETNPEEVGKQLLKVAMEKVEPAQPYDGEIKPLMSPYETPVKSALDEDSFPQVLLIQVTRLYDVGLALLAAVDPEKASLMAEGHAKGVIFSPAPSFTEEEEE